ncbi:DUF3892 domain-containing protein [Pontibacillus salicampi]|uniref:DUF3892 domain-containing protein n=1 Tax=Pontibacillus salicampi TaxID=1449801 RepID=A0ABV6LQ10_9BACI
MAERIVAVRKNGQGSIIKMKLSNGDIVDYKEAQQMALDGLLEHVDINRGKDGDMHLRSTPDSDESNNLSNMPLF